MGGSRWLNVSGLVIVASVTAMFSARRWKSPVPASPWAPAVLDATVAPATCPQVNNLR
jgi:hypothetical protein